MYGMKIPASGEEAACEWTHWIQYLFQNTGSSLERERIRRVKISALGEAA
jgi:hypothetical protein